MEIGKSVGWRPTQRVRVCEKAMCSKKASLQWPQHDDYLDEDDYVRALQISVNNIAGRFCETCWAHQIQYNRNPPRARKVNRRDPPPVHRDDLRFTKRA